MELDHKLIHECEFLAGGEFVHVTANLTGAYRSALELYNESGDEEFKQIAIEAERSLRVLVAKLRMRKS